MESKILFNKELYTDEAISVGLDEFSEYIGCTQSDDANYFILSLSSLKDDIEENIIDEFKNFVLFNSINMSGK